MTETSPTQPGLGGLLTKATAGDLEAQAQLGLAYLEGHGGVDVDPVAGLLWLHKAAERGSAEAQVGLGGIYLAGRSGIPRNPSEGVQWLQKAAPHHPMAQYLLGLLSERGVPGVVPQDSTQAVAWFQQAAQQGSADAQLSLGLACARGRGVTKDPSAAASWLQRAAAQGLAPAQYHLALCYYQGSGVDKELPTAVAWLQKAASQDHAAAQFTLGMLCHDGEGVPQDHAAAAQWLQRAAELGDVDAQCRLGNLFEAGVGVPQSVEKAMVWYGKAAEQGDATAEGLLGCLLVSQEHVTPDHLTRAIPLLQASAERGLARSQFTLGLLYEQGRGVETDLLKAIEWYSKAAAQGYRQAAARVDALRKAIFLSRASKGDQDAQYVLGLALMTGDEAGGVAPDYPSAAAWLRKAATQGHPNAQFGLGLLYERGNGLPQNAVEAMEWFQKAASQGMAEAVAHLEKLRKGPGDVLFKAWGGDAEAQYVLGLMYASGDPDSGVTASVATALTWLGKAAAQGHAKAQLSVGLLCEKTDRAVAVGWYEKAAAQGVAEAEHRLNKLRRGWWMQLTGVRLGVGVQLLCYALLERLSDAGLWLNSIPRAVGVALGYLLQPRWFRASR